MKEVFYGREVPNLFTLQDAVDAALAGGNEAHYIHLTATPVFTAARVTIGSPPIGVRKWKLIIRPQPGDKRATIASSNGSQTILSIGPNPHFYRLRLEGPLHDLPAKWGVDVLNHAPHPDDVAVTRDIEGNIRPSGNPLHTDRGADQAHAA